MAKSYDFLIAGHRLRLVFEQEKRNTLSLVPSFKPFMVSGEAEEDEPLCTVLVDDSLPVVRQGRTLVGRFPTGNGDTVVHEIGSGGYQFIIKDIDNLECCLLQTDRDFRLCRCALNGNFPMRRFGLNNALMMVYSYAASKRQTLLIHASLVRHKGVGYAFTAKSGTGKSTHTSKWLRVIEGTELMNDDNPVLRYFPETNETRIYGSPWSGKTPCYRQVEAPLGAITQIDRAEENSIERLPTVEAFATLLPACSSMKWDKTVSDNVYDTIARVIGSVGIYVLHCLPNDEAAIICHKEIAKSHAQ